MFLRKAKLTSFTLLSVFTMAGIVTATSVVIPSDDELIIGARAIVRGQVTAVASGYDESHKAIFTYVTLRVQDVFKGQIEGTEIVIKEPGGVTQDRGSVIFGTPEFKTGEDVLLYLDTWADGSLRVHQWFLGKFNVNTDKASGKLLVARNLNSGNVTVVGRSQIGAITDSAELSTYAETLRSRINALQKASAEHEAKYYSGSSGSSLRSLPIEKSIKSDTPTPNFTLINGTFPPRWFEPDTNQPVVFRINPSGAPNSAIINDMLAAMNAWSSVSGSSLRVTNGSNTGTCGLLVQDGENTISFNNCDSYSPFSPPGGGCSGILAAAGIISYSLVQTRVVNGITFFRAFEGNMSFNPYASCYFNNSCNVQEIATHELGHALGVGHSLDSTATMYAYAHFDGRCAGLKTDDGNAIRFIYPGSAATAPLAIGTSSLSSAQAGDFYSQSLIASGGSPAYTWSLAGGALPPGLNLNSNGTISGFASGSGTYNLTVRVTDSAAQTAQKTLSIFVIASAYAPPPQRARRGDFDGDGKADLTVWRGLTTYWILMKSSNNAMQNTPWGASYAPYNDIPTPGDFDGDGKVDYAVWRPAEGNWCIINSSNGIYRIQNLGQYGDTPVAADYDGDGKTDLAVWRGSTGYWYILRSSNSTLQTLQWGASYAPYYDTPVPCDYDGDGKADVAVWRKQTGHWYFIQSSTNQWRGIQLGQNGDTVVPGDYDGDGKTDLAVWRGSTGYWYILKSSNGTVDSLAWGTANGPYYDVPEPADYDGDGKTDFAVWRKQTGYWLIINSSNGQSRFVAQGQNGDTPVTAMQW